jgi:hypothetical protein
LESPPQDTFRLKEKIYIIIVGFWLMETSLVLVYPERTLNSINVELGYLKMEYSSILPLRMREISG